MSGKRSSVNAITSIAAGAVGLILFRRALSPKYNLAGRVVFITGGSRGLGLVMAREFGRRGARLAICARNTAELARAASDLQARGYSVETFLCDVTDRTQVERALGAVRASWSDRCSGQQRRRNLRRPARDHDRR